MNIAIPFGMFAKECIREFINGNCVVFKMLTSFIADDEWYRFVFKEQNKDGTPQSIEVTTLDQGSSGSSTSSSSGLASSTPSSSSSRVRTEDSVSAALPKKRTKNKSRSTMGDNDALEDHSSGSDSEETENIFNNPSELDLTPEEIAERELERSRHHHHPGYHCDLALQAVRPYRSSSALSEIVGRSFDCQTVEF